MLSNVLVHVEQKEQVEPIEPTDCYADAYDISRTGRYSVGFSRTYRKLPAEITLIVYNR